MTHLCTIAPAAAAEGLHFTFPAILRRPHATAPCFSATKMSNQEQSSVVDALFEQKRILRSRVRKALKSMDPAQRSQEDHAIQSIVLEAPWFKSSQRLCAYISCSALREVDTSKVLSEILQSPSKDGCTQIRKKLYVPRVEDRNSHMRMLSISSIDDLIANSMNILEPAPVDSDGNEREDVMQANDPVDLFLLPGLAFDRRGRRLGRGGGGVILTFISILAYNSQMRSAREGNNRAGMIGVTAEIDNLEEMAGLSDGRGGRPGRGRGRGSFHKIRPPNLEVITISF